MKLSSQTGKDANNPKPRIFTRAYIIITLVSFVNASNFYLLTVVSSGYARDVFGANDVAGGIAAGIFVVGALLSRAVCGRMLGLLGYKKTLIIGLFIALLASAAYCVSPFLELFLVVRTIHGFGFGIIVSAASTIIADIVPIKRIGEGMGYYQLSATVATALGPLVAVSLSLMGNYLAIFIICVLLLVICLALTPLLRLRRIELSEQDRKVLTSLRLSSFIEVPVLPISTIALLLYLSYGSIVAFLALFTRQQNIAEFTSWFFVAYAIAIVISRPLVSKVYDARGIMIILLPALVVLFSGFVVLSFMSSPVLLVLAGVLVGLGLGATQSVTLSELARITPPNRKGVATNTFFLLTDVGYSVGPMISGALVVMIGFTNLYLTMAGVIVATLIGSLVFRGQIHKQIDNSGG